jgi:hypothetical protein
LDRRLGGPQSPSGRGGEEKNSQPCLSTLEKINMACFNCLGMAGNISFPDFIRYEEFIPERTMF